jgi:ureidoacrylate peracid hydrolase
MNDFLTEAELDARLPQWAAKVGEYKDRFRTLDPRKAALVVVDMQNEFLTDTGMIPVWGGPAIIRRLAELMAAFRRAGRPVIHTRHCYRNPEIDAGATGQWWKLDRNSRLLNVNSPGSEIHPALTPQQDEYVIVKQRYSGFFATNLDSLLRMFDVRDVVVAGVASNCCCEATAHDAFFRDYHVFFLADGTGGSDEASHVAVLRDIAWTYGTVLTCAKVADQLERSVAR